MNAANWSLGLLRMIFRDVKISSLLIEIKTNLYITYEDVYKSTSAHRGVSTFPLL